MHTERIFSSFKKTSSANGSNLIKRKTNWDTVKTIIVEKGTKRIRVRTHPTLKEEIQTDKVQKIVCDSCNNEVGPNICKVAIMRNKDGGPQVLHYHFFFPCWDFESISKKFKNFTLERLGVSIPEDTIISKMSIMDLRNNFEYWK